MKGLHSCSNRVDPPWGFPQRIQQPSPSVCQTPINCRRTLPRDSNALRTGPRFLQRAARGATSRLSVLAAAPTEPPGSMNRPGLADPTPLREAAHDARQPPPLQDSSPPPSAGGKPLQKWAALVGTAAVWFALVGDVTWWSSMPSPAVAAADGPALEATRGKTAAAGETMKGKSTGAATMVPESTKGKSTAAAAVTESAKGKSKAATATETAKGKGTAAATTTASPATTKGKNRAAAAAAGGTETTKGTSTAATTETRKGKGTAGAAASGTAPAYSALSTVAAPAAAKGGTVPADAAKAPSKAGDSTSKIKELEAKISERKAWYNNLPPALSAPKTDVEALKSANRRSRELSIEEQENLEKEKVKAKALLQLQVERDQIKAQKEAALKEAEKLKGEVTGLKAERERILKEQKEQTRQRILREKQVDQKVEGLTIIAVLAVANTIWRSIGGNIVVARKFMEWRDDPKRRRAGDGPPRKMTCFRAVQWFPGVSEQEPGHFSSTVVKVCFEKAPSLQSLKQAIAGTYQEDNAAPIRVAEVARWIPPPINSVEPLFDEYARLTREDNREPPRRRTGWGQRTDPRTAENIWVGCLLKDIKETDIVVWCAGAADKGHVVEEEYEVGKEPFVGISSPLVDSDGNARNADKIKAFNSSRTFWADKLNR